MGQQVAGAIVTDKGDGPPAFQGPEGDAILSVAEEALIDGDGAVAAEGAGALAVELVGVGHLGEETDN